MATDTLKLTPEFLQSAAETIRLRNMLFDTLDYLYPLHDQLSALDRMHVERIQNMSGWGQKEEGFVNARLSPDLPHTKE